MGTNPVSLYTHELEIGDIWNGRRIVRIEPPLVSFGSYLIWLHDGDVKSSRAMAKWEVTRIVERIEQ